MTLLFQKILDHAEYAGDASQLSVLGTMRPALLTARRFTIEPDSFDHQSDLRYELAQAERNAQRRD
jgi:hypothetical protein